MTEKPKESPLDRAARECFNAILHAATPALKSEQEVIRSHMEALLREAAEQIDWPLSADCSGSAVLRWAGLEEERRK